MDHVIKVEEVGQRHALAEADLPENRLERPSPPRRGPVRISTLALENRPGGGAAHHSRAKDGNALRRRTLNASEVAHGERDLQFAEFDAAYLVRLQARDVGTEAHFVAYFGELIRLKLRARLPSKEAIEDARQETFLRVLALIRSDGGVRQPDRLGALVNSVCNNVLREHYRSKAQRETPMDDEVAGAFVDPEPSALCAIELKETEHLVRQTLSELAERDRGLLRCVMLEDRDKGEICAEFGVTREHLRVLVHRAKQSFKSYYLRRLGHS
jgi:RNA polymerase sigma-70 factor (ECF subfamily)